MIDLSEYRQTTDRLKAKRQLTSSQVSTEAKALASATMSVESIEEAQRIAQQIAQTLQQRAHDRIARIVTRCLNAVFDDAYEFHIRFDRKRGKTEAKMVFMRDGLELDDPLNEIGGGVVDVAALALRVACVLMSRPPRRRLLVLDEPLRYVRGKENKRRVRNLLIKLADEMGVQFVLNVDIDSYPEFSLGKIVELE